jgi:hypothetical protein
LRPEFLPQSWNNGIVEQWNSGFSKEIIHFHWMLKGCNLWRIRRHYLLEYGSFFIDESHTKSNDFSVMGTPAGSCRKTTANMTNSFCAALNRAFRRHGSALIGAGVTG